MRGNDASRLAVSVRLNWLDQRTAHRFFLVLFTGLAWAGVFAVLSAPVRSATGANYLIAAPILTLMTLLHWRGWDPARYVVVLLLSVMIPINAPIPAEGWPYPPQGLLLPIAVATLLTGARWVFLSAVLVLGVLMVRAGGLPSGFNPQNLISSSIIVLCLGVTRLVLEASVRESRARAQEAEQARAEAERRTEQVRFQATVLEAVDEALVAVGADGTILYWNRGAEALFGGTAAERVGKQVRLDRDPQREELRRHMLAGQPFDGELELRHLERGPFPVLVHSWPFTDAEGRFAGSVSVTIDLTERRRMEDELRQSEARVRQAQHVARLGVWELDMSTETLTWSPEMFEIYGVDPTEFTGRRADYLKQVHPDDLPGQLDHVQLSIERAREHVHDAEACHAVAPVPTSEMRQFRILRPDGTVRWVESGSIIRLDRDGSVVRLIGTMIDITERKLAELASREAQDLTQALVENTVDGIIRMREDGIILSVNRSVETIFGFAAADLIGQNIKILMPEPDHSAHDGYLARYRETGKTAIIGTGREVVGKRQDGSKVQIDLAVSEFWYDGQRQFVGTLRDITERKLLEEQLRQAQKMEALGQMASGIAHDFNNALTMIVGGVEILQLRRGLLQDEGEVRRYLELMSTAAEDASSVVRRLRDLYRPRAEGEAFQAVDLGHVAQESIELTRPRWQSQAQARGAQIEVRLDVETMPPVQGSPSELREALMNLIFNAVDAMPDGGEIVVRVGSVGEHALVSVADSGTGMPEEVRQRCLEPFFTTKGERGSGLGLGMVYGIVQRHEGTLHIESAPGAGTTIAITLPAASPSADGLAAEAMADGVRRLRVLVVDDEPRISDVLRMYLETDGHVVTVAENGGDALDLLLASPFDLLVTDRAMAGMSGDQLAVAARRLSPSTRIIMLTGFGALMRAADELPPNVDVLLDKPVLLAQLRQAIITAVARSPELTG